MRAKILNRATPPKDGWYQIEVSGVHPAGEGRVQVIDEIALAAIVHNFRTEAYEVEEFPGMLVDADHLSHDLENDTAALAWLMDVDIRNGQLWGKLDLTDLGEPAVKNKRYKFFSTEYPADSLEDLGNGRVRPKRLSGLAFTNRPNNLGGKPISNRSVPVADEETQTDNMKSIAEKLGLPADADEAAILAKIATLMSSEATAKVDVQNRSQEVTNLTAENKRLSALVVETDLTSFKDVIGEEKDAVDTARELFIHNRDSAVKVYTGMRERLADKQPGGRAPIYNRETAKPPTGKDLLENADAEKEAAKFRGIENRAHAIAKERGIGFQPAFEAAKAEAGV